MGIRGQKPKPTAQQIAEGDPSKRGVHKLDQKLAAEPKAETGLPPCPAHVKGLARTTWKFWAEQLAVMKLDKRPDGPMLEGACQAYARAVEADGIVAAEGLIVKDIHMTEEGEAVVLKIKKHPAVEISSRSWVLVKAFCSEFGLSPVSRMRLTIEKQDNGEADMLNLLSQPRAKRVDTTVN